MAINYSAVTKYMFKNYVRNQYMYDQFRGEDPLVGRVLASKESGRSEGVSIDYPVTVGQRGNIGSNFQTVQNQAKENDHDNQRVTFIVDFKADVHGIGRVKLKPHYATKSGSKSFVKAVEEEYTLSMDRMKSNFSRRVYGEGFGELGKVSAVDAGDKSVTFDSFDAMWDMEVGNYLEFASATGTAGVKRATTVATAVGRRILKVEENNRKVILDDVANVVANDIAFFAGDSGKAIGSVSVRGLKAWLPNPTSIADNDSFYNVNRSIHRTRLGGHYQSASANDTILDVIRKGAVRIGKQYRNSKGKESNLGATDVFLGTSAWEALADEYSGVTEMRRINSNDLPTGIQGFDGLEIKVNGRSLWAWACPALADTDGYILNINHWAIRWYGESDQHPVTFRKMTNGTMFKDVDNDDSIEFRIQFHPVLFCKAPGLNCRLNFDNIKSDVTKYAPT